MNIKYIIVLLVAILATLFCSCPVLAWDLGLGLASDWDDPWWTDIEDFAEIITDNIPNWNLYWCEHAPEAEWWQEESSGGDDNDWAYYTELTLIHAHSVAGQTGRIYVDSIASNEYVEPEQVRLGYVSPDGYGYNIWWFIIQCEALNDADYLSWFQCMEGNHMMLGFKNTIWVTPGVLPNMAYSLTGTNGHTKKNIQNAFF